MPDSNGSPFFVLFKPQSFESVMGKDREEFQLRAAPSRLAKEVIVGGEGLPSDSSEILVSCRLLSVSRGRVIMQLFHQLLDVQSEAPARHSSALFLNDLELPRISSLPLRTEDS